MVVLVFIITQLTLFKGFMLLRDMYSKRYYMASKAKDTDKL